MLKNSKKQSDLVDVFIYPYSIFKAAALPESKSGRTYVKDASNFQIYGLKKIDNRKKVDAYHEQYVKDWKKYKKDLAKFQEGSSQTRPVQPEHLYENHIVYTDFDHKILHFLEKIKTKKEAKEIAESNPDLFEEDDVGRVVYNTEDITSTAPLKEKDVVNILESKIDMYGNTPIKKNVSYSEDRATISLREFNRDILTHEEVDHLEELQDQLNKQNARLREIDPEVEDSSGVPLFMYAEDLVFRKLIDGIVKRVAELQSGPVADRLHFNEIYASEFTQYLITQDYADQYKKLASNVQKERDAIINTKPEDCPKIPNVNKDFKLMPHQAYGVAVLDKTDVGIVSVSTGGGKTGIITLDILNQINKGRCKRPLIVMPTQSDRLLPQQKAEIENTITDGNINVICLSSKTFVKMGTNAKARYKNLKNMIVNAPPNTIILCTYDWLKNTNDNSIISPKGDEEYVEHDYERPFWLVNECKIDYVALDESHKIRSDSSAVSQAVMGLSSIPIRRIASGTMVMNNPEDLHRQITFLDPAIFGSKEQFLKTYSSQYSVGRGGKGKALGWRSDSAKRIQKKLKENGAIQVDRSAWLHMIPKRIGPVVHRAVFSTAQQAVYKNVFEEIVGEIEAEAMEVMKDEDGHDMFDPSTKQPIWKNRSAHDAWIKFQQVDAGDEDLEEESGSFQNILKKLATIDAFICSPNKRPKDGKPWIIQDSATGTRKRVDKILGERDLVSPKVGIVDKILDEHFADPKNGKVILMMRNKVSALHFAEHIKRKGQAVYYWSGLSANMDKFLNDPKIKILSAADESILHGFNFQYIANRIIRCDVKWNPGDQDQGYARILRPGSKIPGRVTQFDKAYIDFVLCDKTIDAVKFARIISKENYARQVSTTFQSHLDTPPVSMSLNNIRNLNSLDHPYVQGAYDHYMSMFKHEEEENVRLRKEYGDKSYDVRAPKELKGSDKIEVPEVGTEDNKGGDETEAGIVVDLKKKKNKQWLQVHVDDLGDVDPTILKKKGWKKDLDKDLWHIVVDDKDDAEEKAKELEEHDVLVHINDPGISDEEIEQKAVEKKKDKEEVEEEEVEEREEEESEVNYNTRMDIFDATEAHAPLHKIYLRVAREKDDLKVLKKMGFNYHGRWFYIPIKSKSYAITILDRIQKRLKLHVDNLEDVADFIRSQKPKKLKTGLGVIELTKRLPKRKSEGTITVYMDWIDQKPYLSVSEKEAQMDLTKLRSLGFKDIVNRPMYWKQISGTTVLPILKKLRAEGFRAKNWDDLKAGLSRLHIKIPNSFDMSAGAKVMAEK